MFVNRKSALAFLLKFRKDHFQIFVACGHCFQHMVGNGAAHDLFFFPQPIVDRLTQGPGTNFGLKEKLLAAHRAGIDTVLIPKENVKDLEEVPENVRAAIEIIPAETVDTVLQTALCERPGAKK